MIVPVDVVLGLSAVLFGIGAFGFLARRNIILMFVSVEVMLNAVNLSLAGFSQHLNDPRGQVLALFVIAVAAALFRVTACHAVGESAVAEAAFPELAALVAQVTLRAQQTG